MKKESDFPETLKLPAPKFLGNTRATWNHEEQQATAPSGDSEPSGGISTARWHFSWCWGPINQLRSDIEIDTGHYVLIV